jgi:medium-chain acyl-[acyl-carrier-protein] hydrolase
MGEGIDIFGRAPPDARAVVYAVHHAGGNGHSFAGCLKHLPSEIALLRVQLPGRDSTSREPPVRDVAALFPHLADMLLAKHAAIADGKPFVLYGQSLGALVCFELTRELRARGRPMPAALIISGRRAPQCKLRRTALCLLSDDELIALLPALGGVPALLLGDRRWVQRFLPIIRADLAVSDLYVYRPGAPLTCPILAFKGRHDPIVELDELTAWKMQTQGLFISCELPGAHFFDSSGAHMLRLTILANIRMWLGAAPAARPPRHTAAEPKEVDNGRASASP